MHDPVKPTVNIEDIRNEYLDASNNIRHHGNLRFAQLTLFAALTGGLFTLIFGGQQPLSAFDKTILEVLGVFVAVAFFIMELRTGVYWYHYQRRAAALEKILGYSQYSTLPFGKWITAANATRGLYVAVVVLWIAIWLEMPIEQVMRFL